MTPIRRLTQPFKRLIKQLDIDDIPPASLLFFLGCLLLSLIAFASWRSDRVLLLNGREIRAEVIDRRTRTTEECDPDSFSNNCTTEISYFLTYRYRVEGNEYTQEQAVDSDIYQRAESSIPILILPDRPSISNISQTVQNAGAFPLFSLIAILVGLVGAALIYRFHS